MTSTPNINIELSGYKKEDTLHHLYLSQYQKIVTEKYADNTLIFTDGSKSVADVGSAAISGNISKGPLFHILLRSLALKYYMLFI